MSEPVTQTRNLDEPKKTGEVNHSRQKSNTQAVVKYAETNVPRPYTNSEKELSKLHAVKQACKLPGVETQNPVLILLGVSVCMHVCA